MGNSFTEENGINTIEEECIRIDFLFEQFLTVFYEDFKYLIEKLLNTKKEGDNFFYIEYFARKLTVSLEYYKDMSILGKYLLLKKNPGFKEDIEKAINYTNDSRDINDFGCCFKNLNEKLNYIKFTLADLESIEKEINNNLSK